MHFPVSLPLFILPISLLLGSAISADPLFHFCFIQENYTANSPFASNLNELKAFLNSKAPTTGFGVGNIGEGSDRVSGLALCRGDVTSAACKSCIIDAGKELTQRCPYNKGAIIWYDNCLFKYSDEEFFGQIDNQNKFYMWNVQSVDDPKTFNDNVKGFLTSVVNKAYASPVLFGTGELELGESNKLYGLAQCTRDLSATDCKKCLDGAISELPNCCDGKRGGRVVGGSCNFRYELYPFVNV